MLPLPVMSVHELNDFLADAFPQGVVTTRVTEVTDAGVALRLPYSTLHLRPGGTISGPTLMALTDTGAYAAILSRIGPVALAVTTSLTINFLRKPGQADVLADASVLKLGRRLATVAVELLSAGSDDLVAHATTTYSIPPEQGQSAR